VLSGGLGKRGCTKGVKMTEFAVIREEKMEAKAKQRRAFLVLMVKFTQIQHRNS